MKNVDYFADYRTWLVNQIENEATNASIAAAIAAGKQTALQSSLVQLDQELARMKRFEAEEKAKSPIIDATKLVDDKASEYIHTEKARAWNPK